MQPHYSQPSRENATPSSRTSLLASCKGLPPPPGGGLKPPSTVFKYVRASPTAVLHVLLLQGFALGGSVFCLSYVLMGLCWQCLF